MDRQVLILACVFVALAAVLGLRSVRHGARGWGTTVSMLGAFLCQLYVLGERGRMHGQCPLHDVGEVALFIAWSQTMFYLITGPAFRTSLLGLFSTPVILITQIIALWPGNLEQTVTKELSVDYWREVHLGFSVMAYGAFALAAVAGVMALVLRQKLKKGLSGNLVGTMSSVTNLDTSLHRLNIVGWVIFTVGIIGGVMMKVEGGLAHLIVAVIIWSLYGLLIFRKIWKGLPPKVMAWSTIILFVAALWIFAAV